MSRNVDRRARMGAALAVFMTAVLCARADVILDSTWTYDLDGWTSSGAATVSAAEGSLKVLFPAQTAPEHSSEVVAKQVAPGYRPYRVAFRFKAQEKVPSALRVYIKSATGRSWYKSFSVPVTGEWVNVNALVTYESGWILGPMSSEVEFTGDMNSITEVSVLLVRNGSVKAHSFLVDDFIVEAVLSGSALPKDSDGDGMEDSWEIANGFDAANPEDADDDSDGDGLRNVEEYLAGTDPKDPSSTLALSIESAMSEEDAAGFVLMWSSVAGRYYQVWRATNLIDGFEMLQGGIAATPPVNVYVDSAAPDKGSSFYRIELE